MAGGLRIEPVTNTIEKNIDLALPIFEHILFFLQSLFFARLFRLSRAVYVSEQTFLIS